MTEQDRLNADFIRRAEIWAPMNREHQPCAGGVHQFEIHGDVVGRIGCACGLMTMYAKVRSAPNARSVQVGFDASIVTAPDWLTASNPGREMPQPLRCRSQAVVPPSCGCCNVAQHVECNLIDGHDTKHIAIISDHDTGQPSAYVWQ